MRLIGLGLIVGGLSLANVVLSNRPTSRIGMAAEDARRAQARANRKAKHRA